MKPKYKIRTITCAKCGKVSEKRRRAGEKYCSLECYRTASRPERLTGKEKKCGTCDKAIWVTPSGEKPVNYCSSKCFNKAQSKKVQYTCKTCGSIFHWSPSRVKDNNPTYCSVKCRTQCEDWKRKAVIAGNLKQQKAKGLNKLEKAGSAILDDIGIKHKTQVLICDKFTVDVFVPELNLVIQWDGDYWHGYGGAKDERQQRRMNLDRSQDAYMKKAGLKVLRFWEHEVKNNVEYVKRTVLQEAGGFQLHRH